MSAPIDYIARTRDYYAALGYGAPYDWARFDDVPFTPLRRPLSDTVVAVVTTAAPFDPARGDQGPRAPYNATAKFYAVTELSADPVPDLRISHVAIDRAHTTAEDPGTWLPLAALARAAAAGRVRAAARVFLLPTNRSQRHTLAVDCPDLVARLKAQGVEAAVFVPNCPVCHQSCALAARAVESAGLPTILMGAARDIVERAGVARHLFSDVPLGNAAGLPGDVASQDRALAEALSLLEDATGPRSTRVSSLAWPGPPDWRDDYSNAAKLTPEEIARRRAEFDRGKAEARALRREVET